MHGGCPKPSNLTQKSGFRRNSVLFASAKVKINVFLIVLNGAISQRGLREFKKKPVDFILCPFKNFPYLMIEYLLDNLIFG